MASLEGVPTGIREPEFSMPGMELLGDLDSVLLHLRIGGF